MPANESKTPTKRHFRSVLGNRTGLTHADRKIDSQQCLAEWLEDTMALDSAEAYRHVKPELFHEDYAEAAERMWLDVEYAGYSALEALQLHLARLDPGQANTSAGYVEYDGGRRMTLGILAVTPAVSR